MTYTDGSVESVLKLMLILTRQPNDFDSKSNAVYRQKQCR